MPLTEIELIALSMSIGLPLLCPLPYLPLRASHRQYGGVCTCQVMRVAFHRRPLQSHNFVQSDVSGSSK